MRLSTGKDSQNWNPILSTLTFFFNHSAIVGQIIAKFGKCMQEHSPKIPCKYAKNAFLIQKIFAATSRLSECPLSVNEILHISVHYHDVIMSTIASQITSLSIVCSIVCSGGDQRKHQSSASLAFVRGIHRWPVNSPHKGPVTRKMFPFDDVIMSVLTIYLSQLPVTFCRPLVFSRCCLFAKQEPMYLYIYIYIHIYIYTYM